MFNVYILCECIIVSLFCICESGAATRHAFVVRCAQSCSVIVLLSAWWRCLVRELVISLGGQARPELTEFSLQPASQRNVTSLPTLRVGRAS